MVQIAAFQPLRYDPAVISFISRVVAPPFDVIDEEAAEELRARDRHNVIRLILGKEGQRPRTDEDYALAAATLAQWRRDGVLMRDPEPSLYVCEETFESQGKMLTRRGVFCALLLQGREAGDVLPHEQTTPRPKADRLRLLEACRANLSPVFGILSDAEGAVEAAIGAMPADSPLYEFRSDAGVAYRLWRVRDEQLFRRLAAALAGEKVLIADGHHRHETALTYRAAHRPADVPQGEAPEDFLLLYAVSARDPGLRVLPTHRLVKVGGAVAAEDLAYTLSGWFTTTELAVGTEADLADVVQQWRPDDQVLGCYLPGGRLVIFDCATASLPEERLAAVPGSQRDLPVALLTYGILGPLAASSGAGPSGPVEVAYEADTSRVYWDVEGNRFDLAFLLPPIHQDTVERVARAGEVMPPKSTFFHPKIPSGLLVLPLDDGGWLPRVLAP